MSIRLARPEDSAALLAIYGQYIHTPITFEYDLPSLDKFTQRVSSTLQNYPYLVWEENGALLGYAYAHLERERKAYQWNTELSIYLDAAATGRGLGRTLYTTLMDLLVLQGVKTAYASVTRSNPASEALHRSLGFRLLGVHQNTGYKDGAWYDVLWFEKALASYDPEPAPVLPFPQLPPQTVQGVFDAHTAAFR